MQVFAELPGFGAHRGQVGADAFAAPPCGVAAVPRCEAVFRELHAYEPTPAAAEGIVREEGEHLGPGVQQRVRAPEELPYVARIVDTSPAGSAIAAGSRRASTRLVYQN